MSSFCFEEDREIVIVLIFQPSFGRQVLPLSVLWAAASRAVRCLYSNHSQSLMMDGMSPSEFVEMQQERQMRDSTWKSSSI